MKPLVHAMAACVLTALPAFAEQGPTPASEDARAMRVPPPPAEKSAVNPAAASGMIVHIDPRTGAIIKTPAPAAVPLQLSPQMLNALSTSHQGLVQERSSLPAGGVKVDLQGRFHSPLVATIDSNGKMTMQHLQPLEAGEK